ncbi:hypothetical protein GEMRC1_002353 [Eukaryota sp. GEM-RC1]
MHAYVFGGMSSKKRELNDLWSFDISARKWSQIHSSTSSPPPRYGHSMVSLGSKIYLFGGVKQRRPAHFFNDLWCFDTATQEWTCLSPDRTASSKPLPRYGQSMEYIPLLEALFIFGGTASESRRLADAWIFSLSSMTFSQYTFSPNFPTPTPLAHAGCAAIANDAIIILGGQRSGGSCNNAFIFLFESKSPVIKAESIDGEWNDSSLFSAPSPRFLFSLTVTSYESIGFLCAFGGTPDGTSALDEIWMIELNPFCEQLGLDGGFQDEEDDNALDVSGEVSYDLSDGPKSSPSYRHSDPLADVLAGYFRSHCSIGDVATVLATEIDRKVDYKLSKLNDDSQTENQLSVINEVLESITGDVTTVKKSMDLIRARLSNNQEALAARMTAEKTLTGKIDSIEEKNSEVHSELYVVLNQIQRSMKLMEDRVNSADGDIERKLSQVGSSQSKEVTSLSRKVAESERSLRESLNTITELLEKAIQEGDEAAKEEIQEVFKKVVEVEKSVGAKVMEVEKAVGEKVVEVERAVGERIEGVVAKVNMDVEEVKKETGGFKRQLDTQSDTINQRLADFDEQASLREEQLNDLFSTKFSAFQKEMEASVESRFEAIKSDFSTQIESISSKFSSQSSDVAHQITELQSTIETCSADVTNLKTEIHRIKDSINLMSSDDVLTEGSKLSTSNLMDRIKTIRNEAFEARKLLEGRIETVEAQMGSVQADIAHQLSGVGKLDSELRESMEELEDSLSKVRISIAALGGDLD